MIFNMCTHYQYDTMTKHFLNIMFDNICFMCSLCGVDDFCAAWSTALALWRFWVRHLRRCPRLLHRMEHSARILEAWGSLIVRQEWVSSSSRGRSMEHTRARRAMGKDMAKDEERVNPKAEEKAAQGQAKEARMAARAKKERACNQSPDRSEALEYDWQY